MKFCYNCNSYKPSVDEDYGYCTEKYLKIWGRSLPCRQFDNTEIY